MKEKSKKEFKELSEEELENVNGGAQCFTEDMEECRRRGGIYTLRWCSCSVSVA